MSSTIQVEGETGALPTERLHHYEWRLLEICWQLGQPTLVELHRQLLQTRPVPYAAVHTMVRRLESKGWLAVDTSRPRRHFCRILFTRDEALALDADLVLDSMDSRGPEGLPVLHRQLVQRSRWRSQRRQESQLSLAPHPRESDDSPS